MRIPLALALVVSCTTSTEPTSTDDGVVDSAVAAECTTESVPGELLLQHGGKGRGTHWTCLHGDLEASQCPSLTLTPEASTECPTFDTVVAESGYLDGTRTAWNGWPLTIYSCTDDVSPIEHAVMIFLETGGIRFVYFDEGGALVGIREAWELSSSPWVCCDGAYAQSSSWGNVAAYLDCLTIIPASSFKDEDR
ncbi:MAG: hypothetical protein ACI8PZ_007581 [Myxococcota bacterium]|jgi:hypothetical protein